jgi:Na+-transporting NADH:ubiquinone oxidoreductase subunit NqrB
MDTVGTDKNETRLDIVWARFLIDPRHYQIIILSGLIWLGVMSYGISFPLWHPIACIGSALVTQFLGDKALGRRFDIRSPLISSLSLTLLLRTGSIWLSVLAGILAIGSKYLIRTRSKHIFNPANFAIVIIAVLFSGAWVSPGQWGTAPLLAVLLAGLGVVVTTRAKSLDLTAGFLLSYAALIFGRALWLGDPLSIPTHQLQSGAVLLFAFFMISDPMTAPNVRRARLCYSALVALVGFILQFYYHISGGVIYALVLSAPFVPLFDLVFKGRVYQWPTLAVTQQSSLTLSKPKTKRSLS